MRILAFGSTVQKVLFGAFRALRVDTAGNLLASLINRVLGTVLINNVAGITDGTIYQYFSPEEYGRWTLRYSIYGGGAGPGAGITLTVGASFEINPASQEAATYDDMTEELTGETSFTAAPTVTNVVVITDDEGKLSTATFVRVKLVCAGGAGDDCTAVGWLRQRGLA